MPTPNPRPTPPADDPPGASGPPGASRPRVDSRSRRAAAIAAALAAANAALLAAYLFGTDRPTAAPARSIERAEAEALLAQTVRLAQSGDFAALCRSVAPAPSPCTSLLATSGRPGKIPPEVTAERRYPATPTAPETLVLEVTGRRADGTSYRSDFPVLRTAAGPVKSPAPIYWSGLVFKGTPTPCSQAADEACFRDQTSLHPGP